MDIYSALSDPTRRDILELLAKRGSLSATGISQRFSVSAPAISQHLKILRETNLVNVEKHAQQRIYKVNLRTMSQFEKWVQKFTMRINERFDRLDKVLEQEKKSEDAKRR